MTNQERFQRLFAGRPDVHGRVLTGDKGEKKRAWTKKEPVTDAMWAEHLAGGDCDLGQVPILTDGTCHFGAIDVDDEAVSHQHLAELARDRNIPVVVCRSRSGGAHIYAFFKERTPAPLVVEKLKAWAKVLGAENPDGRPVEIFPKQTESSPKSIGNWISLPYYGDARYAVTPDGDRMSLDDFLDFAESHRLSISDLESGENPFKVDGPCCLERLHDEGGFTEGGRNQALFNIGIYALVSRPDHWEEWLRDYHEQNFDPPLDETEVDLVVKSVQRKQDQDGTYAYTINTTPLCNVCACNGSDNGLEGQLGECQRRKYGGKNIQIIAAGGDPDKTKPTFEVTDVVIHKTDPPQYHFKINGHDVAVEGAGIASCNEVCKAALNQNPTLVLQPIKNGDWIRYITPILQEAVQKEAPPDAGVIGRFGVLFRNFLRLREPQREALLAEAPWQDDEAGLVYFTGTALTRFLLENRFTKYNEAQTYTALHRLVGPDQVGDHRLRILGERLRVRSVPLSWVLADTQDEPYPTRTTGTDF